jgi:uncharacterized protein YjdB
MHVLKLESFKKNFPSVPPDQPMKDYLVEAYFDKELGGDSWSGPIDEGDSGSKSESGAAEPADDKAAADDTAANDRVEGDGRATGDKQLPGEVQPPEKKAASALKSIKIEPESFELAVRTQQQLRATGVYADGTTRDLTTSVDWWCNDLDAISVDKNGLATAQSKEGSAEIAATDGESGVTGSAKVTIKSGSGKPDPASGAVVLQSIKIDPESVELAVGAQHVFRATGVYADGSTRDLTTTVDWWCNDLEAVSIEKNGLATAQSKLGSAEIAATDGASGVTGSAKVTIKPGAAAPAAGPALQSIRVKPASVALDKGETQEFRATGVYADGTENDLILDVVWKSSNPDMVTIDADGLATAQKKKGTAQITATDKSGKVTGSVTVTVQGKGIFKGKFSRGLTADEISDAKSVYQDSIDYSKVKVVSGGLGSVGSSRTIGNTIAMTPKEFEPNSTELTGDGRKTLIHELGHVWQFQHGGAAYIPNALGAQLKSTIKTGDRNDAYVWRRAHKDGLPWEKWNAEQQASAMEDYHQAKKRIAAGDPKPDDAPCSDEETVKILEPYVGKVRDGKGAPGQRK